MVKLTLIRQRVKVWFLARLKVGDFTDRDDGTSQNCNLLNWIETISLRRAIWSELVLDTLELQSGKIIPEESYLFTLLRIEQQWLDISC